MDISWSLVPMDQATLHNHRKLCFAGASCQLSTNSLELMRVLEELSTPLSGAEMSEFSARIFTNANSDKDFGIPHFRGMHHVVVASFGRENVFVFDVLRRTLSAYVSAAVARNRNFWREKLIPITLGVLGSGMGMVPMHCACVESDGEGLLIAGMSGAGKSTLSVALSQGGFNYISDDWTYISQTNNQIVAHGTSAPVKLLPDAVRHFQALTGYNVHVSMNGELAYEVDIVEAFGARVEHACEPRWLFLLERMQEMGSEFLRLPSVETKRYLDSSVERLPKQLIEAAEKRDRTIDRISRLPCWRFRYGGTPQYACKELLGFIAKCRQKVYV